MYTEGVISLNEFRYNPSLKVGDKVEVLIDIREDASSNYLIKMSDYKRGDWQKIWDGLYWRFISNQRNLFEKNIRMKFMVSILDKMSNEKRQNHFKIAENYLKTFP